MLEMFQYEFMVIAFIVALAVSISGASIGQVIVLRRLSQMGDALSHTALAGVAIGMLLGFNPVIGALIAAVLSAFAIEFLRRFFPRYAEISIAIVFSLGIGLAGVLSGFTPSGNFSSFLFGSIVAVSKGEAILVCVVSLVVFALINFFSHAYCYMTLDEEAAAVSGVQISALNVLFTLLTALCISVASRTVGALVVSSLLVLPVASAMQICRSYKSLRIVSTLISVCGSAAGLVLSFHFDLKPGGSIVLLNVLILLLCLLIKHWRRSPVRR